MSPMNENILSELNVWEGIQEAMKSTDSTVCKGYPMEYLKFRGRATMRYYRVEDHVN